jgi:hypothetical protein
MHGLYFLQYGQCIPQIRSGSGQAHPVQKQLRGAAQQAGQRCVRREFIPGAGDDIQPAKKHRRLPGELDAVTHQRQIIALVHILLRRPEAELVAQPPGEKSGQ